jgi:hypothetical protein
MAGGRQRTAVALALWSFAQIGKARLDEKRTALMRECE